MRPFPSLPLLLPLFAALAQPSPGRATPEHGGPVRALAVAADGGALASGGFDERLLVRRPPDAAPRAAWAHGGGVSALAALPNGGWASGGEDGRVLLWADPPGDAPARVLARDGAPVSALAARDGMLLAAGRDGAVRAWALDAVLPTPGGQDAPGAPGGRDVSSAPDRRDAPAPAPHDNSCVPSGHDTFRLLGRHDGPATAAAFRADGAAVTGGADGVLRAWVADEPPRALFSAGAPVTALAALPDGTLAAAIADGRLLLLGADGGTRELDSGGRPTPALAASNDGRVLLAASLGGGAAAWSLHDGRLRAVLGGGAPAWSVALSPDGALAWTGTADGRVLRWDAVTGRPLNEPAGEAAAVSAHPRDPRGARVFGACSACHALRADAPPMAGPSLAALFNRRMGGLDGYAYSPRLRRGDVVWTPDTVAELFTRGPAEMLPGTRMPDQRISDPEDMAALLRVLEAAR